jgi:hypothetical protein
MYGVDMGVFARLFPRSRTTEEVRPSEAEAPQPTAPAQPQAPDEAKDPITSGTEAAPRVTVEEPAQAAVEEGVGIPRQQSADMAADREADEGART